MNKPSKKRLLITAGPTREMLDPVRFLSNLSTGELGYAIARVARSKKYRVTLVSGPTSIKSPRGVTFVPVVSARDMRLTCSRLFPKHHVLIMTAAVCDFTAATFHPRKIRRTRTRQIHLKRTPDIIAGLARRKGRRVVIGFSLETEDWFENARRKLEKKRLDGIVANFYRPGHVPFGNRTITTAFLAKNQKPRILKGVRKTHIAGKLLDWMEELSQDISE